MITAVDTNVLLDVFTADPDFGARSREAVRQCSAEGGLLACAVVWAEIAASFPSAERARAALTELQIAFSPVDGTTALAAGDHFRDYRRRGGTRQRLVADFLVAAHAMLWADRLLTRDRGFYRRYFEGLTILDPSDGR